MCHSEEEEHSGLQASGTQACAKHALLMQELRKANAAAIIEARRQAPDWRDPGGYDLVQVPIGATVAHDGRKMRVFTKADYRNC